VKRKKKAPKPRSPVAVAMAKRFGGTSTTHKDKRQRHEEEALQKDKKEDHANEADPE
jgi:hypothetical protein